MKREDVFNDIFTNPVSGEEYNIFSDNGFGKRLDWEVGKSEDGKETVRPINVSLGKLIYLNWIRLTCQKECHRQILKDLLLRR